MNSNRRNHTFVWHTIIFVVCILAMTLRGLPGNPSENQLNTPYWKELGPLELSPERGRFALTYSLAEYDTVFFTIPLARFTTPDLGLVSNHYVSLFAPGVSFIVLPGYLMGKSLGLAQVGTFAVVALFALLNVLLIRVIALRLKTHPAAALLAGLTFLFATPAFTYAVSLYQHHITTFLMLVMLSGVLAPRTAYRTALIWLCYGIGFAVDYPNALLLMPLVVADILRYLNIRRNAQDIYIDFKFVRTTIAVVILVPLFFLAWYNQTAYGNPWQLAGAVYNVRAVGADGLPSDRPISLDLESIGKNYQQSQQPVAFFQTRNLLNGFYTHALSPDRGIVRFSPVILLGIIGFGLLMKKRRYVANILTVGVLLVVLLYSMWGDPYGGWAFGSRYLIPAYALLSIGLAVVLTQWRNKYAFILMFVSFLAYSVWVNSLGAVTSSKNPPRVEILALERVTQREEKFTFERNVQYLNTEGSKSFLYRTGGIKVMTGRQYHTVVVGLIMSFMLLLVISLTTKQSRANKHLL